jgi:hypothetical protein
MARVKGKAVRGEPEAEFPVKTTETRRQAERASITGSC